MHVVCLQSRSGTGPPCPGEGGLCSVSYIPFHLLPALEVEKIKIPSALFDLGLVVVYSFIFEHEYFCIPASAYILLDGSWLDLQYILNPQNLW